jgi:hypothetical protein
MSDYAHRIMQQIREEDLLIQADQANDLMQAMQEAAEDSYLEILAEDAYHKEQAMREGMPELPTPTQTNEQHKPF